MAQTNKVLNLNYASSLTNLCEINSSFDTGILRIAYPGKNRNNSFISKETFEKCLPTLYNCPIVCNYDRDSNELGGHDVDLVTDNDGHIHIVNITTPVGCIPESARTFWETVEEDDGSTHEYLCAEALIWKRQEAYKKIKEDGFCSQSMEITVKDGAYSNGVYKIYDFEFTALTLIGVTPCFENASLQFSHKHFKQQMEQMMLEIKESFSKVNPSNEDGINSQVSSMEGGTQILEKKIELANEYGINLESLDYSLEDYTLEELKEKFEEEKESNSDTEVDTEAVEEPRDESNKDTSETNKEIDESESGDENGEENGECDEEDDKDKKYGLESNFYEELRRSLAAEKVDTDWGECSLYWFVDYDKDTKEVFCWDSNDWLLYGFEYEVNGDAVNIKFETKKRKKFEIVDFDGAEQPSPVEQIFTAMNEKLVSFSELEGKYKDVCSSLESINKEVDSLRKYKQDVEQSVLEQEKQDLFGKFEDLNEVPEFVELVENSKTYSLDELEEKCFAIRGRHAVVKFNKADEKTPKIKVTKAKESDFESTPYGGVVEKYSK